MKVRRHFLLDANNSHLPAVRERLVACLLNLDLAQPVEVIIWTLERKRTLDQNAGSHALYVEIAKQRGDVSPDEVKAECKLLYGIPILCEDPEFALMWEKIAATMSYEKCLRMMDYMAVTSVMSVRQKRQYIGILERRYNVRIRSKLDGWDDHRAIVAG